MYRASSEAFTEPIEAGRSVEYRVGGSSENHRPQMDNQTVYGVIWEAG
jgi:hypothetical protein